MFRQTGPGTLHIAEEAKGRWFSLYDAACNLDSQWHSRLAVLVWRLWELGQWFDTGLETIDSTSTVMNGAIKAESGRVLGRETNGFA